MNLFFVAMNYMTNNSNTFETFMCMIFKIPLKCDIESVIYFAIYYIVLIYDLEIVIVFVNLYVELF
jgi:hypothetical protein